jgi:hypothetical protein
MILRNLLVELRIKSWLILFFTKIIGDLLNEYCHAHYYNSPYDIQIRSQKEYQFNFSQKRRRLGTIPE